MTESDRIIDMIGHAHLDLVWLWPWQEAYQEARATFRSALDRMEEDPEFVFTCDQVVLLAWVEEQDAELFERIRARVEEGRWVNVGGWWVEPDCNIPWGESLARQGLHGQRFLSDRFGRPATVGMNVDPFGHAGSLPQILRLQGMPAYVFQRPGPHEKTMPGGTLFRWRSADGSEVLAYRIPFEYQNARETLERQVEKAVGMVDVTLPEVMVFYGVGNHGGGPTRAHLRGIHRLERLSTFGHIQMSDPVEYFASARERIAAGELELETVTGDLQHHAPGCYSAHSGIKKWQQRAQSALLVAERWASAAAAASYLVPPADELAHAWRTVLLNQFHDILPGSAIEEAYDDARDQLGEANSIARRITVRAQTEFARRLDIPLDEDTQPVVVFNPHPWPVSTDIEFTLAVGFTPDPDRVTDADGKPVPSQATRARALVGSATGVAFRAELPPFGWRRYALQRGTGGSPSIDAAPQRFVLENLLISAEIDPATGWFSRLVDRGSGVDFAGHGAHLWTSPDDSDTWGHRVVRYAGDGEELRVTRVSWREHGPVRSQVRVERSWGASTVIEDFILGASDRAIEVRVEIDWREHSRILKVRVPVPVDSPRATTEIPFGSITREVDGVEQPGQGWADLSGTHSTGDEVGISIVVEGKHAYDFSPGTVPSIGLTAVRSPVFAWHDPFELDEQESYRYQDQGRQEFRYRIVPHSGAAPLAELHRAAAELSIPPRAMLESFHDGTLAATGSLVDQGSGSVMVTAIKPGEDLVDGRPVTVVRAVETAGDACEATIDLPMLATSIVATFGPHQIRTWRVSHHPTPSVEEVDLVEWPLGTP